MKKRMITLLLVAVMCLSLLPTASATGTTLSLKVSDDTPEVGDIIKVTAEITGNPGFSAVQFAVLFDETVLKCTKITSGDVIEGAMVASNLKSSPNSAMIGAADIDDHSDDGELATFIFKVVGTGNSTLRLADVILAKADTSDIPFAKGNAKITVGGDGNGQPEEETTEEELPVEETVVTGFPDTESHWAKEYINTAVELGLFQGYADGNFRPYNKVTRGAFVTVLWRMAGKPSPTQAAPFTDIGHLSEEFRSAIAWAYENGYVSGRTATTFAPGDSVTRQAAMKILYFYAGGQSGMELMFISTYDSQFTDSVNMPDWAKTAMYWGIYNGLISGTSETTLGPQGEANRAQLAKILVNYNEKFGN